MTDDPADAAAQTPSRELGLGRDAQVERAVLPDVQEGVLADIQSGFAWMSWRDGSKDWSAGHGVATSIDGRIDYSFGR
jgi:hypothetical protein